MADLDEETETAISTEGTLPTDHVHSQHHS